MRSWKPEAGAGLSRGFVQGSEDIHCDSPHDHFLPRLPEVAAIVVVERLTDVLEHHGKVMEAHAFLCKFPALLPQHRVPALDPRLVRLVFILRDGPLRSIHRLWNRTGLVWAGGKEV